MSDKSFAEVVMELIGKSQEESTSIGQIDSADDEVELLFQKKHQTSNSPAYKAVWDKKFPSREFFDYFHTDDTHRETLTKCLDTVKSHRDKGTLYEKGKLSSALLSDLAGCGYFGLLVPLPDKPAISFSEFAPFLSEMAMLEPSVAGLASIHGCIGSVDPIKTFGSDDQKRKWLPMLASGERLSAFALTEPCAGSDMTALKTRAVLDGDDYILNGSKLFITNATYGRLVSVVCLIDDYHRREPQILLVDLPATDTETFHIESYGIHALKRLHNNALVFTNHRVSRDNLIRLDKGNGLTVAYHGLNLGRVSLCANAAGCMRAMLDSMLPWAKYRKTYGQEIGNRELVQSRIGILSSYILSCDALVSWCSTLIDEGYRGELECIVAKNFGSECQKDAAIDLCMKTHGGRSFLSGHLIGDNIHDFLAPLIYEGEGDMLNMAFFKSLVKDHGVKYFEPIGKAMADLKKKKLSPVDMARNYKCLVPYAKWLLKDTFVPRDRDRIFLNTGNCAIAKSLEFHADFAMRNLQRCSSEISSTMRKYQLKLADRQCTISMLSKKIQHLITMLATIGYAGTRSHSPVTLEIADVSCDLLRNKITGSHPTDKQIRKTVSLGKKIGERPVDTNSIMMRY
jgi:alkylation response protein AidB-like acyl-CoA dehydrogenase